MLHKSGQVGWMARRREFYDVEPREEGYTSRCRVHGNQVTPRMNMLILRNSRIVAERVGPEYGSGLERFSPREAGRSPCI